MPGATIGPDQSFFDLKLEDFAVFGNLSYDLSEAMELTLAFREGGEVDFAETQMRAQRALGTPDAPTDLALELDYRLQHLLVDEFQDTSSSQHRLLRLLTAGWQPGESVELLVEDEIEESWSLTDTVTADEAVNVSQTVKVRQFGDDAKIVSSDGATTCTSRCR